VRFHPDIAKDPILRTDTSLLSANSLTPEGRTALPVARSQRALIELQRRYGNRVVQRMLATEENSRSLSRARAESESNNCVRQQLTRTDLVQRSNGDEDPSERSRQSRPRNAPPGTVPIDQSGKSRDEVHEIKEEIGAGPRDWVGISPEGHVISTDPDGSAVDHGSAEEYLHRTTDNGEDRAHQWIPRWVWGVIGVAAAAAIVACFASGACEFAALVALLGTATAALVIEILRTAGISDSGAQASADENTGSDETAENTSYQEAVDNSGDQETEESTV
jgi:hypothetical protein